MLLCARAPAQSPARVIAAKTVVVSFMAFLLWPRVSWCGDEGKMARAVPGEAERAEHVSLISREGNVGRVRVCTASGAAGGKGVEEADEVVDVESGRLRRVVAVGV